MSKREYLVSFYCRDKNLPVNLSVVHMSLGCFEEVQNLGNGATGLKPGTKCVDPPRGEKKWTLRIFIGSTNLYS